MTRKRLAFEVIKHGWKARPWVVIMNFGVAGWDIVSHHATEASAQRKAAAMNQGVKR